MTLIIKELIIRGEVVDDEFPSSGRKEKEEDLTQYLAEMRREMEKECYERVLQKLENHALR